MDSFDFALSDLPVSLLPAMSTSSAAPSAAPTNFAGALNSGAGTAQTDQGITIGSFIASLAGSFAIFGLEFAAFLLINGKLHRIYLPRTFLVPERERTTPPPKGVWQWMKPIFQTRNSEFIQKSGLDAYFFLRYLRTLLKIFVPCTLLVLPILLPVNAVGGRGPRFAAGPFDQTTYSNVNGLDELAWGNVSPYKNSRYWTHLVLAVVVIVYACWVFFDEFRGYIRLRQAYLTSPQHRLRASATTVLVTAIPSKWCTFEALDGLYDVFPGGIRNIWINRNFDELSEKIKQRNKLAKTLESAETAFIRKAKAAAKEKAEKDSKKKGKKKSKTQLLEEAEAADRAGLDMAQTDGVSSGNPHQMKQTLDEILNSSSGETSREQSPERNKPLVPVPVLGAGIEAVGHGIDTLGKAVFGKKSTSDDKNTKKEKKKAEKSKEKEKAKKSTNAYKTAHNENYHPNEGSPKWKEYIKEKDRDTMRLPIFGWQWMFPLPLLGKKVDTIYYCRQEVARLNLEIEEDQKKPEKYPLMNSAFVQFNHQVAAHMACQSVSHHTPLKMAPRVVEISPNDVIWENMSTKWWESYIRTGAVLLLILGLVVGWAVPVTFTGLLSHLSYLGNISWLTWVDKIPDVVLSIIQGILPPALLALLLVLLPLILRLLARLQGDLTGMAVELTVQKYYFAFLFIQLFLVVSISSGITTIIPTLAKGPQSIPSILAGNLPKASNYFFSYMLLQAFSVSGGALVQLASLFKWYILAPLMDSTARQKWRRQIKLPNMKWGTFFPVYTNLACIGLIYSVISPLILVFNIITFSLFWVAYRYNTLYVTKFSFDTGGLLYPTAINQLFTGLYVMELCLIGLFFLVRDVVIVNGVAKAIGTPCKPQAIVMIVIMFFTIIFQWLLNNAFGPLLRYLPITLEDEAVMRDEEFARAQEKRWAMEDDEEDREREASHDKYNTRPSQSREESRNADQSFEMQPMEAGPDLKGDLKKLLPQMPQIPHAPTKASWADRKDNKPRASELFTPAILPYIKSPRHRSHHHAKSPDPEAQHSGTDRIGAALFAGINDEIEDLTPADRDKLVRRAFQHEALRARRPVIWIPRDDLGISDEAIARTKAFSEYIWISNEGTGLDGKGRVIYNRSPPDFSEIDLIEL